MIGLREGDVLLSLDGMQFPDPRDFMTSIKSPPFTLRVSRRGFIDESNVQGSVLSETFCTSEAPAPSSQSVAREASLGREAMAVLIQRHLPQEWHVGTASGQSKNCLIDALLQVLDPSLVDQIHFREEKASQVRQALVSQCLCDGGQFLDMSHIPHVLHALGEDLQRITIFVFSFVGLESQQAPEKIGTGGKFLFIANVHGHMDFAPVFTMDSRVQTLADLIAGMDPNEGPTRAVAIDAGVKDILFGKSSKDNGQKNAKVRKTIKKQPSKAPQQSPGKFQSRMVE
jgi:hypothetical protein